MALRIGFANKYYTLWNVTENTKYTSDQRPYKVTDYHYIQNLSIDLDKARKKASDMGCEFLELDPTLKGKSSSFEITEKIEMPDDVFKKGKYYNQKYTDINDVNYMVWYYNSVDDSDNLKEHILSISESHVFYDKEIITKERHTTILKYKQGQDEFRELATKGTTVDIELISNINSCYEIRTTEFGRVDICRDVDVKEYWYNDFVYYLPFIKGKGKRIKNKKISCTLGMVHNTPCIKSFNI